MLCGSHLHYCAHKNPVCTMVFTDTLAMLVRKGCVHEHVQASQLANPGSISVGPGSPAEDLDVHA